MFNYPSTLIEKPDYYTIFDQHLSQVKSEKDDATQALCAIEKLLEAIKKCSESQEIIWHFLPIIYLTEFAEINNKIKILDLVLQAQTNQLNPLHLTTLQGNLSLSLLLIEKYAAFIHQADAKGKTPLHAATTSLVTDPSRTKSVSQILCALIQGGAQWNARNLEQETPFYICVQYNRLDILEHFFKQLTTPEAKSEAASTLLQEILPRKQGFLSTIEYLFNQLSSEERNTVNQKFSFLHEAINSELPIEIIKKLVEQGANLTFLVNAKNALHCAIKASHMEAIKFFLQSKNISILLNAQDSKGNTPFHYIVESFSLEIVKLFLCYKPNILKVNNKLETSIHKAICNENTAVFMHLMSIQNFNLNQADSRKNTYLHVAAQHNKLHIIQRLLWAGAQWDLRNNYHKTPFEIAIKNSITITPTLGTEAIDSMQTFIQYCPELGNKVKNFLILGKAPKRVRDAISRQVTQNIQMIDRIKSIFEIHKNYAPAAEIYRARKKELCNLILAMLLRRKQLPIDVWTIVGCYVTLDVLPYPYQSIPREAMMNRLLEILLKDLVQFKQHCLKRNIDTLKETKELESSTGKRQKIY